MPRDASQRPEEPEGDDASSVLLLLAIAFLVLALVAAVARRLL